MIKTIFSFLKASDVKKLVLTCKYFCVLVTKNPIFDPRELCERRRKANTPISFYEAALIDNVVGGVKRFLTNYPAFKRKDPTKPHEIINQKEYMNAVLEVFKKGHIETAGILITEGLDLKDSKFALTYSLIKMSVETANFELIKLLLNAPGFSLRDPDSILMDLCKLKGGTKVVRLFLEKTGIAKIENGQLVLVKSIYNHLVFSMAEEAIKNSDTELLKFMYGFIYKPTAEENHKLLYNAIKFKSFEAVEFLLSQPETEPSLNDNEHLIQIISSNQISIARLFLKATKISLPTINYSLIADAIRKENIYIIKLILKDERLHSTLEGYAEAMKLVELDYLGDKDQFYSELFKWLCKYDDFKLYWSNFGGNPFTEWLYEHNYLKTFNVLFENKKIPVNGLEDLLYPTVLKGSTSLLRRILKLLLDRSQHFSKGKLERHCARSIHMVNILLELLPGKVFQNPQWLENYSLIIGGRISNQVIKTLLEEKCYVSTDYISEHKYYMDIGILKELLKNPDSEFFEKDNGGLLEISRSGDVDILKLLLTHPKIDPTIYTCKAVLEARNLDVVKILLKDERFNPALALVLALTTNNAEIIKMVLADKRINPLKLDDDTMDDENSNAKTDSLENLFHQVYQLLKNDKNFDEAMCKQAIKWMIEKGCSVKMIVQLLSDERLEKLDNYHEFLYTAFDSGRIDVIKWIYAHKSDDFRSKSVFQLVQVCEKGFQEIAEMILNDPALSDSEYLDDVRIQSALHDAIKNNHIQIANMLLNDKRMSLEWVKSSFKSAIDNKRAEIVRLFLSHEGQLKDGVNKVLSDSSTLYKACNGGDVEIVKLLLGDSRLHVNRHTVDLFVAVTRGSRDSDIIKILLSDSRINSAAENYEAFFAVCRWEDVQAVDAFLNCKRIKLDDQLKKACFEICKIEPRNRSNKDLEDILELLLLKGCFDPSVEDNFILKSACSAGYTRIVKMLLSNSRLDSTVKSNELLVDASKNGHIEIVKMLLADKRVDPSINDYEAMYWAENNNHYETFKLLKSRMLQDTIPCEPPLKKQKKMPSLEAQNSPRK